MATITQRLTALEAFRDEQQRPWNKTTSDRIAALEAKVAKLEAGTTPTPPVPVPPTGKSVTVTSIKALNEAITDDTLDEIVVKDGTYTVTGSTQHLPTSLWIGGSGNYSSKGRTRPLTVRAQTPGGVIFDGAGKAAGIAFEDGAHHQTWDGFRFRNILTSSGVIEIAGYSARSAPHHITLRRLTIESTCTQPAGSTQNHAFYFSHALPTGPNNILLEDITIEQVVGSNTALYGGIHAYHGNTSAPAPHHVTIRRLKVTGCEVPIVLWWDATNAVTDWLFEDVTIKSADTYAIRFEQQAQKGPITFRRVTSTGSRQGGFSSSLGANPGGVVFDSCSLA